MPRRARLALPNVPLHLIQRGNNRQTCLFANEEYRLYLEWLGEHAGKTGCRIHACVLMTNHVHLLLSAERAEAVSTLMKALGQRYVQYVNRTYLALRHGAGLVRRVFLLVVPALIPKTGHGSLLM